MSGASWGFAVVGGLFLYVALGIAVGRFCRVSDPGEDGEYVNWLPTLPPVPPSLRTVSDDDWFRDVPAEIVAGAELDRRFFTIVDAETRWFA